jgi:hypothetical protein
MSATLARVVIVAPSVTSIDEIEAAALLLNEPLLRLWRARGLNRIFNSAVRYAPAGMRDWIERERTRARDEDQKTLILQRSRLVPEESFRALVGRGLDTLIEHHGREQLGDYLEFGVYNGTSMTCVFRETQARGLHGMRLLGFDSFQGLPPDAHLEDEGRWRPGSCCSTLDFTTACLESEGVDLSRVTLIPGWFADTLNDETSRRHGLRKASLIMIDCDVYSAAKQALAFSAPFIVDRAVVLLDEYSPWGLEGKMAGERRAFEEFLSESGCFKAEPFGSYIRRAQAFLVSRV